ncbi:hypothetical protein C0J52_25315 [Blattella germanica]|nr:hypothetical protein C0J52_25315 [Blattella germanica]
MFFRAVILLATLLCLASGRVLNWRSKQYPWERSGQFEGDIKLTKSQQKNGIISTAYRWPDNTMPYQIASGFSTSQLAMIQNAIDEYHAKTCVTLRPYNSATDRDYVYIKGDESGCWSYVGRIGGRQELNLGTGCFSLGTVEHELLHAWGFYHQQSATERDDYVTIHWENIQSGTENNFEKYSASQITSFGVPYDYTSVMHYSAYAFSKNGEMTIEPKDPNATIGQRNGFSAADIQKLGAMYGC